MSYGPCIAPSILSADFSRLGEQVSLMCNLGAHMIHIDVMDGHFVPNITIGPSVVSSLRGYIGDKIFFDCHLMVREPAKWIDQFALAGASGCTVHIETFKSLEDGLVVLSSIRNAGMKVGLAVNPSTPIESTRPYIESGLVNTLLVMTVEPGFGGQPFNREMIDKIKWARNRYPQLNIQVDGGIGPSNIDSVTSAGANIVVAGTSIFGSQNPESVIKLLKNSLDEYNKSSILPNQVIEVI